jgi:hypothetical protein
MNEVSDLSLYKDTVMHYKTGNGVLVSYNKALKVDYNILMSSNRDLEKKLHDLKIKKPTYITIEKSEVLIDSIKIQLTDSSTFDVDSPYYSISGHVKDKLLTLDTLLIPDIQSVVIGKKKSGFLQSKSYIVTVTHSNPYISTIGLQSYDIKYKKTIFEKWWFQGLVGFGIGYTIKSVK